LPLHFLLNSSFSLCHTQLMSTASEAAVVQGRVVSEADLKQIRGLIVAHPGWSRRRLSKALATNWDWRKGLGQLKDMATRSLSVKLAERGWIELPARRQEPTNRMRVRAVARGLWDTTALAAPLAEWGPTLFQKWQGSSVDLAGDGWVFPSERGKTPVSKDNCWRRHFGPRLKSAGLEWVNFHVMRRLRPNEGEERRSETGQTS
jgi:hypothetical protein